MADVTDFRNYLAPEGDKAPANEDGLTLVDKLLVALRHPVPDRAGLAIDVLAYRLREPKAIVPLIKLLSESMDAEVLKQAALALGYFRDPRAVEPLRALRGGQTTPLVVRLAAVEALAQIGGEEAERGLCEALADLNESVQGRAAGKLGERRRACSA